MATKAQKAAQTDLALEQTAAPAETKPKATRAKATTAKATKEVPSEAETKTTTATETKTAVERTKSDLFMQTATEIEGLTKAKALAEAVKLHTAVDSTYFRLGGILAKILENKWFDDHETFGEYVEETFGFKERKARYLIEIYVELVNQRIPHEKVSILGWTKIKMLAKHLDVNNVDEWVERASNLSVRELEAVLKAQEGGEGEEGEDKNTETKNSVKKMTFQCHPDQVDAVNAALAHAKAEKDTEFDNVALEHICNSYLSGTGGQLSEEGLVAMFKGMDAMKLVELVDQAHGHLNFRIDDGAEGDGEGEEDTPL
ncbi:MAG: hypothetical protein RR280_01275 [Bacteroidaceae bacterium]